jgi:hypothetical protein
MPVRLSRQAASSGKLPMGTSAPLSDRYAELVHNLDVIEKALETDRLNASRLALIEILRFLNSDSKARKATRSLGTLLSAVHDVCQGARPSLLFDHSAHSGPPTHRAAAVQRAQIVMAFECLVKSGEDKQSASEWIARKLTALRVLAKGKTVGAKEVLRWHYEGGAKSLSGYDKAYKILRSAEECRGWPSTPASGRNRAEALLKNLKASGF